MEKGTPHCKLPVVKALIEAGQVRATASAFNGARELGICDLTGMDRRTVKKRLADIAPDSEYRYSSVEALRQIYIPSALDPQQERAQLDRARREIADLQKSKMMAELIPADVV